MAGTTRKTDDKVVGPIREALLRHYITLHPRASIDVKRYNSVCVWVRIVDPDFTGLDMVDRDETVWNVLEETLSDGVRAEISMLFLLTPKKSKTSMMNLEFEDPTY